MKHVWVVNAYTPYEGSDIVGIYASEGLAQKRIARLEASCRRYDEEMRRTDYASQIKFPQYHGTDLVITKMRVIAARVIPIR